MNRIWPAFVFGCKNCILLLALCWATEAARAQSSGLPTIKILPGDVVQGSIQQHGFKTNRFWIRWAYTEAGAKKMLAFREAHTGQKIRTVVGRYESPETEMVFRPMPAFTNYASWRGGWLKTRTDNFFSVSEADAKAIVVGLKGG